MKPSSVTKAEKTHSDILDPDQDFRWPEQAMKKGEWHEAARRWAIMQKAYPQNPKTWFQRGQAYIKAGELKKVNSLLVEIKDDFLNHLNFYILSADLLIEQKKWLLAESFLEEARNKFSEKPIVWMKSSVCAEKQGMLKQAISYNEKAREYGIDTPGPFMQYAEIAMRAKQWEQALERWREFRDKFPKLPSGYLRASEAARKLGMTKLARQLILTFHYGEQTADATEHHNQQTGRNRSEWKQSRRLLELIWIKAIFNIRSEVQRNYLSYGWWVIEPLLHMAIFYIVFGILLKRGGENFTVFLLTGLIPWMWFMKAVNSSSKSILAGRNLILQTGLPSIIFPLVSFLQSSLKQIPAFILLFGFVWFQNYSPGAHWIMLIPVIIVQMLMIIFISCSVAAIIPFVRDLSHLVPTSLTFIMFLSGIFYDYRSINPEWQEFFMFNPVAFILDCYRNIIIQQSSPDLIALTKWGLCSVLSCTIILIIYQRLRYVYPRIVL